MHLGHSVACAFVCCVRLGLFRFGSADHLATSYSLQCSCEDMSPGFAYWQHLVALSSPLSAPSMQSAMKKGRGGAARGPSHASQPIMGEGGFGQGDFGKGGQGKKGAKGQQGKSKGQGTSDEKDWVPATKLGRLVKEHGAGSDSKDATIVARGVASRGVSRSQGRTTCRSSASGLSQSRAFAKIAKLTMLTATQVRTVVSSYVKLDAKEFKKFGKSKLGGLHMQVKKKPATAYQRECVKAYKEKIHRMLLAHHKEIKDQAAVAHALRDSPASQHSLFKDFSDSDYETRHDM